MRSRSPISLGSPVDSFAREVMRKFASWRGSTSRGLRRIPDELWNSAAELAAQSSVHRASRLLRLDYVLLKKRLMAAFGPNCQALPGRSRKPSEAVFSTSTAPISNNSGPGTLEQEGSITPSGQPSMPSTAMVFPAPDKLPGRKRVASARSFPPKPKGGIASLPADGFLEASLDTHQTWLSPPLLAEVRSPTGALLRLYSPDTTPIIKAFLRS